MTRIVGIGSRLNSVHSWIHAVLLCCGLAVPTVALAADAPGLGDPGPLVTVALSTGLGEGTAFELRGPDARAQLIATGQFQTGQLRDLTPTVTYSVNPQGIVSVDASGLVAPLADGEATITATEPSGKSGNFVMKVSQFTNQPPINFPNQIVPIFTKMGCNGGGCHGKASGQNGFKLSLLGFYPSEDYEYLVKEARGRRLFPAAPDRSLLLVKATNRMPHGGGMRLDPNSTEYQILKRWISQGMPYGNEDDPTVAKIEVYPPTRVMERGGSQQISVIARYTDGSTQDVTRMTQFEPNNQEMAESTPTGLVNTLDLTGDVAIMARYQGQVSVFRASIPLGVKIESLPPEKNFIDNLVFGKLKTLGIPPSPVCDDATFIRRVSVAVTGKLPTAEQTSAFLADSSADKRDRLINQLLSSTEYADFFANKWSSILRNKRRQDGDSRGTFAFHSWIRAALYDNLPYDQFVRQVLAASGELGDNPPVVWYREVKTTEQQVEDTAQLFLGLRIQCARCHHHPFEVWSQDDYYSFAAFFSRVGTKTGRAMNEPRIVHLRGAAAARNPKTGQDRLPAGLGTPPMEISPDEDPRQRLADWLGASDNPFFAKALVNRYWNHFFGRGLVDPEDDMRVTNPPSNPELLNALAQQFIEHKFDLKWLVKTICESNTFQLSSEPNEYNLADKNNFSRYYPQRLPAEVLLDAINQVTETNTAFNGMPQGIRAVQLPDQFVDTYFLTVFGKPQSDTACECERSQEANLAQSLHLLNSQEIQGKLSSGRARTLAQFKEEERPHADRIKELYVWAFSREPAADELQIALDHIQTKENKQEAYENILWALINTKEFIFNH